VLQYSNEEPEGFMRSYLTTNEVTSYVPLEAVV
jgi:hypothetical protein